MKIKQLLLRIIPVFLSCAAALLIGCSENLYKLPEDMTHREKFQLGKKYFFDKDYRKAQIVLDQVARLNIIADFSDSAQFLLAESYFNLGDYLMAENEYQRVLPSSPFLSNPMIPKALFMIGMCNYKYSPSEKLGQKYTNKAINAFENFLVDPRSQFDIELIKDADSKLNELYGKLAKKDFDIAITSYKKMGEYESAILYLNFAIFDYNYNPRDPVPIVPRALFERGECYAKLAEKEIRAVNKLKKYQDALDSYEPVFNNFPDNAYAEKARERYTQIKNEIAKTDTTLIK